MRPAQKLKWLAAVLFLGILGALPFQRTRSLRTPGQRAKSSSVLTVRRAPVVLSVPHAPQTRTLESPASIGQKTPRLPLLNTPQESPPPSFESSYRSLASRRSLDRYAWHILKDPADAPTGVRSEQNKAVRDSTAAASPSREGRQEEPIVWRMHRLRDGDTLANLAQRYLKDARFAGLILSLNQDLISQPEILPLGVAIKIPPRDIADSLLEKLRESAGKDRSKGAAESRMVPVPAATLKRIGPANP